MHVLNSEAEYMDEKVSALIYLLKTEFNIAFGSTNPIDLSKII